MSAEKHAAKGLKQGGPRHAMKELSRRVLGIKVVAGGQAFPQAYLTYEVTYQDGSRAVVQGRTIHATPYADSFNGSLKERKRAGETVRSDLYTHIHAASLLLADIEHACLLVDGQLTDPRTGKVMKPTPQLFETVEADGE